MRQLRQVLVLLSFCFLGLLEVSASSNKINSIDMNIKLDQYGNAYITEFWNMDNKEGTEVYKVMNNLGNSQINNFKVQEKNKVYDYINWNIHASFDEKKYKNGINKTSDGYELCWGISQYGKHTYQISYQLSNFVSNVEDKQMIYWQLVNSELDPSPQKVRIVISGPTPFEDSVPVWGYGYKGYAYVKDGKIYMETENGLSSSEYMVLLANFELGRFQTTNNLEGTFDEWLEKAEEGTFEHDYDSTSAGDIIEAVIVVFFFMVFFFTIAIGIVSVGLSNGNGIKGTFDFKEKGKKFKDINYFRDIPCNKDIYRAYFVATLYGLTKKKTDFLGSNLLKWLNQDYIEIIKKSEHSKKEDNSILLKTAPIPELEVKLYEMLNEASKDGVLEKKEFGRWCSNHYSRILNWFDKVLENQKQQLLEEGKLKRTVRKKWKLFTRNVIEIDDSLRMEAEQLAGLKKFLLDFSDMKHKEAIEVHLWKEYLMFAQIFGIADKVAKQFKQLYPDVITDADYTGVIFVNNISYYGTSRATSARNAAESYNSGGGGFSSGGGGFGSFGGGSGGGTR